VRTQHQKAAPRAGAVVWAVAVVCTLAMAAAPPAWGQCDPQELAKLLASDAAANDYFGYSVSVSGDTAVIGAYYDDHAGWIDAGSAYVLVRSGGPGAPGWTQQAKLTASDAATADQFGWSVSVSGDTAVIGAWGDDHTGRTNAGSAYVFVRSSGIWTQQAKLTASDAASTDLFGFSVSVSGDTAVIGAPYDNHAGWIDAGSAYIFIRSSGVWTQQAKLTASDAAANDYFGYSVSVSGDTAVIGAYYDDHAGGADAGSAYVFVRSGGVWTQQAKLTASDAAASDHFGRSVSVSGDTAVIGAMYNSHAGGTDAGSAYVFVRSGGVWTQQAKLTASDAAASDYFGQSVSVSGDTAVIGAYEDDHAGGTYAGSAYVFARSEGVWTEQAKLTASDAAADDEFGVSVSVSGDTAVIGARWDDHAGGSNAGSAYVFDLNCSMPGDLDGDGDVDLADFVLFADCLSGPGVAYPVGCDAADLEGAGDGDVDLADFAVFQELFTGSSAAPGDLDGDGDVDLADFVLLADCLNGPGVAYPVGCDAADLESPADGDVDEADFAVFQAAF